MEVYSGKSVSNGVAFGTVYFLRQDGSAVDESPSEDPAKEWDDFVRARERADGELLELFESTRREIGENEAMIVDVQRLMLNDGDFNDAIESFIKNDRNRAAFAVSKAGKQFTDFFSGMNDPYMKSRASDVADLSQRLVKILTGRRTQNKKIAFPFILLADDLTPSETLQLDKKLLQAIVTRGGSTNSHTAILARALNIPCIVQTELPASSGFDGAQAAIDGYAGRFYLKPDEETVQRLRRLQDRDRGERQFLDAMRGLPTVTEDGRKVRLYANIGGPDDLERAVENDAEGIGLLRSEFLYLGRSGYPGEEEQFRTYRQIVEAMKGRTVIIRTMDIGADKTAPYFDLVPEANPALGLRAVRLCFQRPEIFMTQLRAIYRAAAFGTVGVMFPMITSVWEVRRCREMAARARRELGEQGIAFGEVQFGIMIETPAAALIADELAPEVDFFSVGTNDLTQYTLAVDRQNENLAPFLDPHHPALLRLLKMVADSAHAAGIWAGICGELAADPEITRTLLQMGYDELSVSPGYVLGMRKRIREMNLTATGGLKT